MKSKINIPCFLNLCLLLSLYTYFYVIHLPQSISTPSYLGIPIVITILSIVILGITKSYRNKHYNFNTYVVVYLFILFVEFIFTVTKYQYISMGDTVRYSYSYIIMLSYFVFSTYAQQDIKAFLKLIIYFADFAILIILFQAFIFNEFNIFFLNRSSFSDAMGYIDVRNSGIRLIGTYLIDFTALISVGLLFSKKRYISIRVLITNILLTVAYELFSAQTRSMQLIFGLTIAVTLQFYNFNNKYLRIIIRILMAIIIVFIGYKVIDNINGAILSKEEWSYYHRIDEINFFWNSFKKSILMGNGLIPEQSLSELYAGNIVNYVFYDDVGVIGVLGKLGLLGLYIYIWPLFYIMKQFKLNVKNRGVLLSLFVTILVSMLNLSLLDYQRLIILPLYFAVLDAIRKQNYLVINYE